MPISVIFRVDASISSGLGHMMRCLTLAEELRSTGAEITFISRRHPGDIIELIQCRGFLVHALPLAKPGQAENQKDIGMQGEYAQWLSVPMEQDAVETQTALLVEQPDWLVVDHYGIDRRWEEILRPHVRKILVIDDLANRPHDCDVLLDQSFGATTGRYNNLIPLHCTRLLGPRYALLRPEFADARKCLPQRMGEVRNVLVCFGGTDPEDVTGRALDALSHPDLADLEVEVVLGASNPHRATIERKVNARPGTRLHIQVTNIASLMAKADLSVGAGGGTARERLCLGLPSLVVTVAANQERSAATLHKKGCLHWLGPSSQVGSQDILKALLDFRAHPDRIRAQSRKGMALVSGEGTRLVSSFLTREPETK